MAQNTMSSSISRSFDRALESFKSKLKPKDRQAFENSSLSKLEQEITAIQKEQSTKRSLRCLVKLKPFIEAMTQLGEIIGIFANASPFVAFVWGPMKFLLQATKNFAEGLDALLDTYQDIGEHMPLLAQYNELFHEKPYMQDTLVLIYEDILKFHATALAHFQRPAWKNLFRASWTTFKYRFIPTLLEMERHRRLLGSQATVALYENFRNEREAAERKRISDDTKEDSRRRLEVLRWLAASTAEGSHDRVHSVTKEYPNSGQWLLKHPKYQSWINPANCTTPCLWMNGIPGAGKTVLVSIVIEQLRKINSWIVVFFYCKHGDAGYGRFLDVAKSILSQLLTANPDILHFLYDMMSSVSGEATLQSSALAEELLQTAVQSVEKVFVVIDGLDECSDLEQKKILQWFKPFINDTSPPPFYPRRCMFVSQRFKIISKFFSDQNTLSIQPGDNKKDIEIYTSIWCSKIQTKFKFSDPEKKNELQQRIMENASGMFLYAKLVCKNLYEQPTLQDLDQELSSELFPDGLDGAYARIVDRVLCKEDVGAKREVSKVLLDWLVCAKRPLTWGEIQSVESMDFEEQTMDFEGKQLRTDSKELCGSLVEMTGDNIVELVHSTAAFYLVRAGWVKPGPVHLSLAHICLDYLSWPCFDPDVQSTQIESFFLQGYYLFCDYALVHWLDHLTGCLPCPKNDEQTQALEETIDAFLSKHFISSMPYSPASDYEESPWQVFANCDFFGSLCQAITATKHQMASRGREAVENEALDLPTVLANIRSVGESVHPSLHQDLKLFYGANFYKCSRLYCRSFYRGFSKPDERKGHLAKHDRPYRCFVQGCAVPVSDFVTLPELKRHHAEKHGNNMPNDDEFPPYSDIKPLKERFPAKGKKSGKVFSKRVECDICHKMFHRKFNLDTHMGTHEGVKPFPCSLCPKSFGRRSDCNRHEEKVHAVPQFVCRAPPGEQAWGCGKGFTSLAGLDYHLREEGKECIKDLWEQGQQSHRERDRLPKAVLDVYPGLREEP